MRTIALESAVGGIFLSILGMIAASLGLLCGSSENKTDKGSKKSGDQEISTSSRKICRSIALPAAVKADVSSAVLDEDVLTLTLPKAEPAKEIPVKAA